MELGSFLDTLRSDGSFSGNVTYWGVQKKKGAAFRPVPAGIHPELRAYLEKTGITKLYAHQAEAYGHVNAGRDVVLTTPTASGKSLAYNLPVLDCLLKDPDAKAVYLFPTKALSQDQVKSLEDFSLPDLRLYIYDGDTPSSIRQAARKSGRLIVTNPDMLHTGILPNHPKWVKIFDGLKYIVIDELHTYRGVFGSHLAHVITRLKRIAGFYDSNPTFIASSATIANPDDLFYRITGKKPLVIEQSGAPAGEKHYIIYNPPLVNREQGIRRGVVLESVHVARRFIENDLTTIVFARSRLNTEVILSYLKQRIPKKKNRISGYRGGYLPNERRDIERGLRDGDLLGVVSTNALELGIDIGSLDVSIMAGYPGTVSSFFQQAGRAGRTDRTSVSILVASNAPLDQYIAQHAEYLMGHAVESALVNPQNVYILIDQVKCAAFELPFKRSETYGGEDIGDVLEYLDDKSVLHEEEEVYHWQDRSYPAENVSLRSADAGNFVIIDRTGGVRRVIGEMDRSSVPILLHENAIYIHGSAQYTVLEVDWDKLTVTTERSNVNYYTDAESKTDIKILEKNSEEDTPSARFMLCDVLVRTVAVKYKKIKFGTHENVGFGDINLPPTEIHTKSLVLSFKPALLQGLTRDECEELLLSLSPILKNISSLFVMTDPRDIGVAENLKEPHTGLPTLFLYDRYPGGVGLSDRLYEIKQRLLQASLQRVQECGCENGCPSCVGPERHNKKTTARFLKDVLSGGISLVGEKT
ncbi:MAG: DEAD/DEAH box helicase [Spirochaetes bacterium]|nr:DEAD/DEAH box helicase [Spirochaetota bacterium]